MKNIPSCEHCVRKYVVTLQQKINQMKTIRQWAEYYQQMGFEVSPYNKESNDDAIGLHAQIGRNGMRAICFYLGTESIDSKRALISETLKLLGLSEDYPWIIYISHAVYIIIRTDDIVEMGNRGFNRGEMLWKTKMVLPAINPNIKFYHKDIPLREVAYVGNEVLFNCVKTLHFGGFLQKKGIEYKAIIPPINSDIYVVQRSDGKWGALRLNQEKPIVEFGRYAYMWGYEGKYCLVNKEGMSGGCHKDRGIIDINGNEVIKPYTYNTIWRFYGKKWPDIRVEDGEWGIELDKNDITHELRRIKLV